MTGFYDMDYKQIQDNFGKIKIFFLDTIFPIECLGCGEEGKWICESCFSQINLNSEFYCPICHKKSPWGRVCNDCQGDSFLDGILISAPYDQKILQDLIHCYKYKFISDLAEPLSRLLADYLRKLFDLSDERLSQVIRQGLDNYHLGKIIILPEIFKNRKENLLVPVPLHKKRFKERGFNQSELLANKLAQNFGFTMAKILERRRYTTPQVNFDKAERKNNMKDAFICLDQSQVAGRNIILIDDVFTTGSTMQECAKVLKAAGAGKVWGLALARG
jgi:ComF family protein